MLAYQRSVDIIKLHAPDYEFRTTLIGGVHTTLDIDSIGEIVRGAKNYYLQKYRVAHVLDPTFT